MKTDAEGYAAVGGAMVRVMLGSRTETLTASEAETLANIILAEVEAARSLCAPTERNEDGFRGAL